MGWVDEELGDESVSDEGDDVCWWWRGWAGRGAEGGGGGGSARRGLEGVLVDGLVIVCCGIGGYGIWCVRG